MYVEEVSKNMAAIGRYWQESLEIGLLVGQ